MTASQTLAGQLSAVARLLMRRESAALAGVWPRAAALLARESIELSVDRLWAARAPGMEEASTRAQLVSLPSYVDPGLARQVSYTWWALSRACHLHAYELAPTAEELDTWIEVADRLDEAVGPPVCT